MINQMQQIIEKTSLLMNKENKWELFGSRGHRFLLNPPLSEKSLQEFELQYDISLPEDYRMFLKEVCNGGFGPFYGMYSLEDSISIWNVFEEQPINVLDGTRIKEKYIVLSHEGCGYYFILVVSGPDKGSIWNYLRAADETMYPTKGAFLEWYENWLDYALKVAESKNTM